jgi:hypothetical protein
MFLGELNPVTDPSAQQRDAIRKSCDSLRKLLASERPLGTLAILQEVARIERAMLTASDDELPMVTKRHDQLMERLYRAGIINAQGH